MVCGAKAGGEVRCLYDEYIGNKAVYMVKGEYQERYALWTR